MTSDSNTRTNTRPIVGSHSSRMTTTYAPLASLTTDEPVERNSIASRLASLSSYYFTSQHPASGRLPSWWPPVPADPPLAVTSPPPQNCICRCVPFGITAYSSKLAKMHKQAEKCHLPTKQTGQTIPRYSVVPSSGDEKPTSTTATRKHRPRKITHE